RSLDGCPRIGQILGIWGKGTGGVMAAGCYSIVVRGPQVAMPVPCMAASLADCLHRFTVRRIGVFVGLLTRTWESLASHHRGANSLEHCVNVSFADWLGAFRAQIFRCPENEFFWHLHRYISVNFKRGMFSMISHCDLHHLVMGST